MAKRFAIKIGSNVLTLKDGTLNRERMIHLVAQVARLRKQGYEVILISSGAVAAGRSLIPTDRRLDTVSARQLWSSVGQVQLVNTYSQMLEIYNLQCAQILVTKEDFRDREHYLNMKNCIGILLEQGVIPIINENDAVSITALMFTDNDELAGLISSMMDTDGLIILSNVDGIFNGPPDNQESSLIPLIDRDTQDLEQIISTRKSSFGRGGMLTKSNIARRTALGGIPVYIANGTRERIILDVVKEKEETPFTKFAPGKGKSNVKKWLAHSEGFAKAEVVINVGACEALFSEKAISLLPIGVENLKGDFKKGDLIRIVNPEGILIGLGKAQYDRKKAEKHMGQKHYKPLVHYDYLYLAE